MRTYFVELEIICCGSHGFAKKGDSHTEEQPLGRQADTEGFATNRTIIIPQKYMHFSFSVLLELLYYAESHFVRSVKSFTPYNKHKLTIVY
jgi:hypothetical protein